MPARSENSLRANDDIIRRARAVDGKERPIAGVPGLWLRFTSKTNAAYVFRYRINGKQRRIPIGDRRIVTVAYARNLVLGRLDPDTKETAAGYAMQLKQGIDPRESSNAATLTLKELVDEFVRIAERPQRETREEHRRTLARDVLPTLGTTAANKVTSENIATALTRIEGRAALKRGRGDGTSSKLAAKRARDGLASVYRFAVQRRLVKTNPVQGIGFQAEIRERTRTATDGELKALWNTCDVLPEQKAILVRLCMLTGQRAGEVSGAHVNELHLDVAQPHWLIPADRMKGRRVQRVPLVAKAAELFRRASELAPNGFLFPPERTRVVQRLGRSVVNEHLQSSDVAKAMRRACNAAGIADLASHDLRRTMSSWLAENGTSDSTLDKLLAHAPRGVTRKHYVVATFDREMREALEKWTGHVAGLVDVTG